MDRDTLAEILSSPARLTIMSAVSNRPRTLGELAYLTGISVQGVLRHLQRLSKLGLIKELKIEPTTPKARIVYESDKILVGDYSSPDLVMVKVTDMGIPEELGRLKSQDLETLSGDLIVLRRRVREEARRLSRLIEEHLDSHEALVAAIDSADLGEEERLMLKVILTEETVEDGIKVLSRYYGLKDRRSIDRALARARRVVSK